MNKSTCTLQNPGKQLKTALFLFIILFTTAFQAAYCQNINTVVGTGIGGYTGDGGAATAARINGPSAIYIDVNGNIYFCDGNNNAVRKISVSGVITTIAGTGFSGYSGDGGPATAAQFNDPGAVVKDAAGNVYISDLNNNRVRKIDLSGNISTIAGTGTAGYSGDGGAATAATIRTPYGLALDSHGNLYIAEQYNHVIRMVTPSGTISTFAGSGTAGYSGDGAAATAAKLSYPNYVSVDANDNVFITDNGNHCIRKINTLGVISTYAGTGTAGFAGDGGPATAAKFNYPGGLKIDAIGNIVIADNVNNRIRRINAAGIITTIAGDGTPSYFGDGGPATAAELNGALDVAFDNSGNVYICDFNNNRIRKINFGNTRVQFTRGASVNDSICKNATANNLDTILTITDPDASQTITWALHKTPLHGTASVAYTTTSTGSAILPTGLSYTPAAGYIGTDSLVVWVNDGMSLDTCTVHITVYDCHLAVNNVSKEKETLTIYPNPNNGTFLLNMATANEEQVKIVISDVLGKKVKELTAVTNKPTNIQLDNSPGVYFIEAYTSKNKYVTKILVNK